MIELKNVTKIFNRGKPNEYTAVAEVCLTLEERCAIVFKGPSGSGKTTLLSVIGCMAKPTAGRVTVGKREVTSLPERFLTAIRRKTFGFVFQQFNLVRGISALENVMLPAYPNGERHAALRDRAQGLLAAFDVAHRSHAKIEWLSGGEAQRVAIARALINDPAIIIADEPTAHLDTKLSRDFLSWVERLRGEGRTVLLASHDPLIYESEFVDRIVEMRDGRILTTE
jgi:putative ABC transport system ATP-binding protein